jgi:radical SAM protein with 4Fe4S-binding SPASM domain
MSVEEFQFIIEKIKPFTRYIYLHVLGEPLLHPHIEEILDIARANNLFVNITTNGSLISKHKDLLINKPVRQLNISLHDWEENVKNVETGRAPSLQKQMTDLFQFAQQIAPTTYVSFRLWNRMGDTISPFTSTCLSVISDYFGIDIPVEMRRTPSLQNIRLSEHIFLQNADRFDWQLNDGKGEKIFAPTNTKNCYALRDHIAILSDGSIVPCCIDADANLLLGNIFTDNLTEVLSSPKARHIKEGFVRGEAVEEYCQSCGFR